MKGQLKINTMSGMNLYLYARLQELNRRLLYHSDLTTIARVCEVRRLIEMINLEEHTCEDSKLFNGELQ